jgi:hypothetical protein
MKNLPAKLHAAYDWTAAAGELRMLSDLTGEDLATYAQESADNARDNLEMDVAEEDITALAEWLRTNTGVDQ